MDKTPSGLDSKHFCMNFGEVEVLIKLFDVGGLVYLVVVVFTIFYIEFLVISNLQKFFCVHVVQNNVRRKYN
jgi:hypothetical protein